LPEDLGLKSSFYTPSATKQSQRKTLQEIEKKAIMDSLQFHQGNLSETAKELNISRQTIYNKMKLYDIE